MAGNKVVDECGVLSTVVGVFGGGNDGGIECIRPEACRKLFRRHVEVTSQEKREPPVRDLVAKPRQNGTIPKRKALGVMQVDDGKEKRRPAWYMHH